MGFHPFVNQGGRRIVRWHRLVLVWAFVLSASLFGSCTMGYLLVGDWLYGVFVGLAAGVTFAVWATVSGFQTPVDRLPRLGTDDAAPPHQVAGPYRTLFGLRVQPNQSWTWRDHVRWELKWTTVELIGLFTGLYLVLAAEQEWSGLGTLVLCAVLSLSVAVRLWHYDGSLRPRP